MATGHDGNGMEERVVSEGVARARVDLEESAAKATKVIDDLRRQLEQAKAQVKDLDGHNAELKARLTNASGSEGEAFALTAQLKKDLTNSRGENFELRAQLADLSEQLRRARLETMDANAAAKAGEANVAAAEEVTRLRTQIAEMSAQQRDWDDAWRNGKEALMRVHAQELQNQREAALEEAERHVERELRELRDKCGDLSRDKMLLEEEVSKMRRTSEQLEVVHSALADARAELRNREGEASLRAMEFGEMEAEMLRERERREKLEKKLKKNGGGISAEEAGRLAAEAAAREDPRREEALAHEAGERTKLEGVVKALREKMKNVLSDEKLREALEALRRREKETTAECERLRKELAALRAAAAAASSATANGTKDETAALAPPQQDHVNFGAYVQKRREGKHREAKNMAKRAAAQTKRYFGINNDNNNGVGGGVVGGVGGKFGGVCTGVRSKSPSTAPVPLARKTVMGGGMTMNGAGGAGGGVGRENGGVGAGSGSTTALPPVTMTENSGVSIGVDVVGAGGGHTASTTIRHGRRRGGVQ